MTALYKQIKIPFFGRNPENGIFTCYVKRYFLQKISALSHRMGVNAAVKFVHVTVDEETRKIREALSELRNKSISALVKEWAAKEAQKGNTNG